jgi:ParB-like chromosome segregation protein Spo0J
MAVKINTGDSEYTRQDYFFVDPFEVEVREELRGRHKPPTDEQIVDMAVSMHTHGQRQPVEARKVENNRLRLNLGFTRTAAARLIRNGFKYLDPETNTELEIKDEEFKLKVVISDANDQKAFENNIVENCHRNQTSPVDDAHNQQRLRDKYGYTDGAITKLYRYKDENKVARLRRLLSLPNNVQDQVHLGLLPVQAAIDLLDLPEDKRDEAIAAATNKEGVVVASQVRSVVREHILNDEEKKGSTSGNGSGGNGGGNKPPATKARVLSEVRTFLQDQADNNQDEAIQKFCKNMLSWIAGKRTDKFMKDQLDALLDAERS